MCQNATLLEITCHDSLILLFLFCLGGGAIGEQRHPTASGIACSSVLYGDSRSSLSTGKQAIEYGQEIPQTNPRHRDEQTHNTDSHKQQ